MKKLTAAAAAAAVLSGCAFQPIALRDDGAPRIPVPYAKVVIDDLSVLQNVKVSDTVWVNGWIPVHQGFAPPVNESFVNRVKKSVYADGPEGHLTVSVIRVGLFMEKNLSDDMVFVNFFTMGRERGFKCNADIGIKTDGDMRRITLEHSIRRSLFDNQDQIGQFVETCHDELLKQLAAASKQ